MSMGCRSLTDKEIALLLKYLSPRDATIFQLGLKTGFRITELLSLKISDLFEHNGTMKETLSVARKSMKGKRRGRSVPMSVETQFIIKQYLNEVPKGQTFLFESSRGQLSRCQAWRKIKTAAFLSGLTGKIATHSGRKSLAMRAYKASGKDIFLVQKILGHASIQSTMSYLSIEPENLSAVWKEIQK